MSYSISLHQTKKQFLKTFLGLFIALGGVAAGVVLMNQPQLLGQKAAGVDYCLPMLQDTRNCPFGCEPDPRGGHCKPASENKCATSGQTRCKDINTPQVCNIGTWQDKAPCGKNELCTNGKCTRMSLIKCVGFAKPGVSRERRCKDSSTVIECGEAPNDTLDAKWHVAFRCGLFERCVNGNCVKK